MAGWFQQGFDEAKKQAEKVAERVNGWGSLRRLWMPVGTSKDLVFVDDSPFLIYEHSPKINGDWRNYFTCLRGIEEECPSCEQLGVKSRYYVGYFTVINCSPYTDKNGNTYQYELCLLQAKSRALKILELRAKAQKGLTGKLWRASRTDDKSPTCGDVFDIEEKDFNAHQLYSKVNFNGKLLSDVFSKATDEAALARVKKYFQVQVQNGKIQPKIVPFNYLEQLKPLSVDEMRYAIKGAEVDSFDKSASKFGSEDGSVDTSSDIPF